MNEVKNAFTGAENDPEVMRAKNEADQKAKDAAARLRHHQRVQQAETTYDPDEDSGHGGTQAGE